MALYRVDKDLLLDLDEVTAVRRAGENTNNYLTNNVFVNVIVGGAEVRFGLPFSEAQYREIHSFEKPKEPEWPGHEPEKKFLEGSVRYGKRHAEWRARRDEYEAAHKVYNREIRDFWDKFEAATEKACREVFEAFLAETGLSHEEH